MLSREAAPSESSVTMCPCLVDKVRKFAASIAEDEKLIAKFKKDETEKLKVQHLTV